MNLRTFARLFDEEDFEVSRPSPGLVSRLTVRRIEQAETVMNMSIRTMATIKG
jgi:hypothetical protein